MRRVATLSKRVRTVEEGSSDQTPKLSEFVNHRFRSYAVYRLP
jgi:hypothetical protein